MAEQDVQSIINIINLYGFAVDSQRWDLFDQIFTGDVEADFSESAHWRDLAGFKADQAPHLQDRLVGRQSTGAGNHPRRAI